MEYMQLWDSYVEWGATNLDPEQIIEEQHFLGEGGGSIIQGYLF